MALSAAVLAEDGARPTVGRVQGKLADSSNSHAVSRATVTLIAQTGTDSESQSITTSTDPDGSFLLDSVPPGVYTLTAKKPGFVDALYGSRFPTEPGIPISVRAGETVGELHFPVLAVSVIAGTVQNDQGEPLSRVSVRALQYRYSKTGKRLVPVTTVVTDDRGEYRLHDLLPGRYYVACSTARDRALNENGKSLAGRYPVTFYPSVTTADKASPLTLTAGNEAVANFTLAATRSFRVVGKIVGNDPGGKPGLEVVAKLAFGDLPRRANVDDDGSFAVTGLLPGMYRLIAGGSVEGKSALGAKLITIEDGDLNDVQVALQKESPPIGGRVLLPWRFRPDALSMNVKLTPAINSDPDEAETITMRTTGSGSDVDMKSFGRFAAAGLERPAKTVFATVDASGPEAETLYVSSVVQDHSRDVTDTGFDPASGGDLTIQLSNDGGYLEGTALGSDGRPLPGATISLFPDEDRQARPDLYRMTRADQQGHFALPGIAPGSYRILAWQEVEPLALTDLEFLKDYILQALTVEIGSKTKYNIPLPAIPAEPEKGIPGR